MHPTSISDRKTIFKNKFLELYTISAYFKDFKKDYFIIDYGKKVGILIMKNDLVLLVKQYRYLLDTSSYEIPGGKTDENETLEQGAIRECFEETGLQTEIIKELPGLRYANLETKDNIKVHLYQMKIIGGKLKSESKDIDLLWVPIEKAEEYFDYQNMKDYISSVRKFLGDAS